MERFCFIAEESRAGTRLDSFVADEAEGLSRSAVQKLIAAGRVTVNRCRAKANHKLKGKDVVEVAVPDPVALAVLPEAIPLTVLFEDTDLIVIDKPKGMVVHPAAGHAGGTLVNALLAHCGASLSGINGVTRPGIVHRIDKDTSGILVAAKTDRAHRGLAEQLAEHRMRRVYTALVFRALRQDEGTVDKPIARHPVDRKKMAVVSGGKRAVTHYRVLERFQGYTLIEARLETGRTHQIRVHMTDIGHPLVGDKVYGPEKQPFAAAGQTLHAGLLGFTHPLNGRDLTFRSPLPPYFEALLQKVRRL